MKFFATAALIVAVNAACVAEGDNVCDPAENKCTKRVTSAVTADKKLKKKYDAALKNDSELALDYIKYECKAEADATALVEASGTEDASNGVTFTYTIEAAVEGGAGSGATTMKAAAVAAALGLIAYM